MANEPVSGRCSLDTFRCILGLLTFRNWSYTIENLQNGRQHHGKKGDLPGIFSYDRLMFRRNVVPCIFRDDGRSTQIVLHGVGAQWQTNGRMKRYTNLPGYETAFMTLPNQGSQRDCQGF